MLPCRSLSSCRPVAVSKKKRVSGRVPQLRRTYKDATWLFPSSAGSVLVDLVVPEITPSVLSFFRPKREKERLMTPRGDARGRMHKVGFSGSIRSSLGESFGRPWTARPNSSQLYFGCEL